MVEVAEGGVLYGEIGDEMVMKIDENECLTF